MLSCLPTVGKPLSSFYWKPGELLWHHRTEIGDPTDAVRHTERGTKTYLFLNFAEFYF